MGNQHCPHRTSSSKLLQNAARRPLQPKMKPARSNSGLRSRWSLCADKKRRLHTCGSS